MDPLPSKGRVLAACRGNIQGDHPVLRWASELAEVHNRRLATDPAGRNEIEQRRVTLIHDIDQWVASQLPPSLGCARLHTESLGAVIDRLSKFTACACAWRRSPLLPPNTGVLDDNTRIAVSDRYRNGWNDGMDPHVADDRHHKPDTHCNATTRRLDSSQHCRPVRARTARSQPQRPHWKSVTMRLMRPGQELSVKPLAERYAPAQSPSGPRP